MSYIGSIDKQVVNNFLKPAYVNYKDPTFDLTKAKDIMIHYVRFFNQDESIHLPPYTSGYKFNLFGKNKLRLNVRGNDDITFYISVKSCKLYVMQ
jgi:hypothetical protein